MPGELIIPAVIPMVSLPVPPVAGVSPSTVDCNRGRGIHHGRIDDYRRGDINHGRRSGVYDRGRGHNDCRRGHGDASGAIYGVQEDPAEGDGADADGRTRPAVANGV